MLSALALGSALAAPQGIDADAEILPGGIRPPRRRPTARGNDDDGFQILVLEPPRRTTSLMSTLLRELFGLGGTLGRRTGGGASPDTRTQAGEDATPLQESGNTPNLFFDRPFFTDIFRRPFFPRVPSFSGLPSIDFFPDLTDLPDNYDNSTHEVKMVNGSRVEMNRTVSKTTNDNGGVFYTHVHTIRRLPESAPDADNNVSAAGGGPQESPEEADAQTPKSGTVPQGNSADNQVDPYEDFGVSN